MELTRQNVRVQARRFILEILNNSREKEILARDIVSELRIKFLAIYDNNDARDFFYSYFEEKYKSGESAFDNNMYWQISSFNLEHAGFVDSRIRGFRFITERGKKFLDDFKTSGLSDFDYFHDNNVRKWLQEKDDKEHWDISRFNKERNNLTSEPKVEVVDVITGDVVEIKSEEATSEMLKEAIANIEANSSKAKGDKIEKLVEEVFKAMGYSCTRTGVSSSSKVKDGSGDGGIDMLVSKDELGLKQIPVQVKGWVNEVPTSEVDKFAHDFSKIKKDEGIFVATTTFAQGATREALKQNITLINIDDLVKLMIKHQVGVKPTTFYSKDNKFFEDL